MLTDAAIRHFKARAKVYKASHEGGLILWVLPTGVKVWRELLNHQYIEPQYCQPSCTLKIAPLAWIGYLPRLQVFMQ